jgi:TolB-like protein/DNA-binding winged helix-turn-helix (wHTH) protein/Tfp pilus assembly protein PilF
MELLIFLVERRGDLVSRDEIAERLWGKDVFLDVDHSINVAVRKIRVVLRDDSEKPRFLETVVGKGYRFAAPVISNSGASEVVQPEPLPSPPQIVSLPVSSSDKRIVPNRLILLFGGLLLLALLLIALLLHRSGLRSSQGPAIKSLAVLPLKNLSGDPDQEYLADGMTEALIGRLATIHDLRVISRTSAMHFKDSHLSVPDIARTLSVDAILEGSVIREGNQVRVHAQLIRAATDEHIWADEYQREYRSLLDLQEELARSIVAQIELNLTPQERGGLAAAQAVDPEAHEDYLKGQYYFNQRTPDAMNKSIVYFRQAIARDPNYALAYSGLADTYAVLGFRGGVPSKDALSQAKAAALKAVALDNTIAEPHASLAFIAETHEWDWATAEREYKRALELNPGDARLHHWYAGYLMYTGKIEQGVGEAQRARDLDPLSLPINNALAGRLLVAGRYDEAMDQVQKTLELDPNFVPAHQTLGWVVLNQGKHDEAIRDFQKALQLSGSDDADILLDLGFAYATAGKREQAREILARLKEHAIAPPGAIGILYGALGDFDQAFAWLDKAYDERDPELTYLKVPGRRFEPLRRDPRFHQLVERVGLPD